MNKHRPLRYVSLFSGIEAASVAAEPLGWEPVCFCEIDAFPSAVLAHHYPDVQNLGDITKVDWKEVLREHGPVDVVVGGSPCQSFSIAGKKDGLAGASGLMFEYIRAISEIMPRYWVWENVPGALSSSGGTDFECFLGEMAGIRGAGGERYGIGYRVLDAQFFGVAQRRRRLFAIGVLGDFAGPCEILFESEGLRWDSSSSREKRKALAADTGNGIDGADGGVSSILSSRDRQQTYAVRTAQTGANGCGISNELSHTVDTTGPEAVVLKVRGGSDTYIKRDGKVGTAGKGALMSEGVTFTIAATQDQTLFAPKSTSYVVRRLTPRECERLQGFPDDWTRVPYRGKPAEQCPDGPRYKAIGNSMAVPNMRWIFERIQAYETMTETPVG